MYYGATTAAESQLHKSLVSELADFLKGKGHKLSAVDGVTDNQPDIVKNENKVGDGENKMPDVDAQSSEGRVIRGEAKCGNGDIESEHSITQFKLFSSRNKGDLSSWLYIIIPQSAKSLLEKILSQNLSESQRKNVGIVFSDIN